MWSWRYEKADGSSASALSQPEFTNQADAETWIGETWRELLDSGVDQVTLFEGDRLVYGPMSLHPA